MGIIYKELREGIKDKLQKGTISVQRPDYELWLDKLTDRVMDYLSSKIPFDRQGNND